jgi:AraC-like DNA-binding protein
MTWVAEAGRPRIALAAATRRTPRADRRSGHRGLGWAKEGARGVKGSRQIIVWLEVRVLPAPPRSPTQTEIARCPANWAELDLSISQIAWLLGYQEVSALTHAYRRWTGKTPREARSGAAS